MTQYLQLLMKEKIIITIWRAQLIDQSNKQPIICRITYGGQSRKTKPSHPKKSLVWKQTFVMALSDADSIRLDFIRLQEGEQIHYAGEQVVSSLSFGFSLISINVSISSKGTLPVKSDIFNEQSNILGKVFIEYEVLKTEVAYVVQKKIDYLYLMKLSSFRVSFIRSLKKTPNFFLNLKIGSKQIKEDFPFNSENSIFTYDYPIKVYVKKQTEIQIQLQVRDLQVNDYYNQTSMNDQSYQTNSMSTDKQSEKSISKKNPIDIIYDKVSAIMDLTFKKNVTLTKKLPLYVQAKNGKREIGAIQFNIQTFFRSKQQLDQLNEQLKAEKQKELEKKPIQKKKKYQVPKNGIITVNSIIVKMEAFNEEAIEGKDFSLEVKLGKNIQFSSVLENPGNELIFIDSFLFKRSWEETIKFTIITHNQKGQKLPTFYSQTNLRQLWDVGRINNQRLTVKDQMKNYCGQLIIDIVYSEEQPKKKQLSLSLIKSPTPEKDQKQIKEQLKKAKRQEILQRMKNKEIKKRQERKSFDIKSMLPHFQEHQLLLPPLKHRKNPSEASSKNTFSPKSNRYVYNKGGSIIISKSPRFEKVKQEHPGSFFYKRQSDFQSKGRGPFIGYGQKSDFTKISQKNPGVGRYQIPSVWDKYK